MTRPHGKARADRHNPRAWAICDSCGALYNKSALSWQYDWAGNRLVNQNWLVCSQCYDTPQEQLRSIVLPADPTPIVNPRPERYTLDNNPVSPLGISIGTLTQAAGLNAAFDSNTNKPMFLSACRYLSTAGLNNSVGRNWTGLTTNNSGITASGFQVWAPNNAKLFGGGISVYAFQGSPDNSTWTTLSTGSTVGSIGEVLAVTSLPVTSYLYHQFVLTGDGINSAAVAQLQISQAG